MQEGERPDGNLCKSNAGSKPSPDSRLTYQRRALPPILLMQLPSSPLLLTAIAPLLAGLAGASRPGGHQALAERLSGLVNNKLCACKAEAAGVRACVCLRPTQAL